MALPLHLPLEQMQTKWKSQIDPLLSNNLNSVSILEGIQLKTGINVVNHKLQKKMQGWWLTDIDASITYYRSAPLNDITLTLTCSGPATVNIGVF